MRVVQHTAAALAGVLSLAVAGSAAAADTEATPFAAACHAPTALQSRLLAKADEGVDVLRSYVFSRRNILQVDLLQVGASLDSWRAGAECVRQAEAARDAARVVATSSK